MPSITIYATPTCPYCIAAKRLLKKKNLSFHEVDVTHDPELRNKMRKKAGGINTVPQIWIKDTHIGGYDDLHAMERSGDLDKHLQGLTTK